MLSSDQVEANWRRFVLFRVLFNARFYYPVLAIFFLDLGLSVTEYTLLNFAWAIAITLTDVPAGALADRFGRKPLVVAAGLCLIGEMALLLIAPQHGGQTLFLVCLANRILSGVAEGLASGADEALVFDSLAERGRSADWPLVLDQVMRWQSVGLVAAMLIGGASYDPIFMNHLARWAGFSFEFQASATLRFPIWLNLGTAILAMIVVLGLREPKLKLSHRGAAESDQPETALTAWELLLSAGRWIAGTPVVLFVLVGGVLMDSVVRLLLTFSSSYFRLIGLPEASYGLIGAALAGLGLIVSPMVRRLVSAQSLARNYGLTALVVAGALCGVAGRWNYWGVIFVFPLSAAMAALAFQVSYYLNALVDSHHRATVLSFKGFAFNLGYGLMGLIFAFVLRFFRDEARPEEALAEGFRLLPVWILISFILFLLGFWRYRKAVRIKL